MGLSRVTQSAEACTLSHQVWKSWKSERYALRVASAFSAWAYSAADLSASVSVGVLSAGATGTGRFISLSNQHIFDPLCRSGTVMCSKFQPFAIGHGKGDYRE